MAGDAPDWRSAIDAPPAAAGTLAMLHGATTAQADFPLPANATGLLIALPQTNTGVGGGATLTVTGALTNRVYENTYVADPGAWTFPYGADLIAEGTVTVKVVWDNPCTPPSMTCATLIALGGSGVQVVSSSSFRKVATDATAHGSATWASDAPVPISGNHAVGTGSSHALNVEGTNPGGAVAIPVTGKADAALQILTGDLTINSSSDQLSGTLASAGDSVVHSVTISTTGLRYLRFAYFSVATSGVSVAGVYLYLKGRTSAKTVHLIDFAVLGTLAQTLPRVYVPPMDLCDIFPTDTIVDVRVSIIAGVAASFGTIITK